MQAAHTLQGGPGSGTRNEGTVVAMNPGQLRKPSESGQIRLKSARNKREEKQTHLLSLEVVIYLGALMSYSNSLLVASLLGTR